MRELEYRILHYPPWYTLAENEWAKNYPESVLLLKENNGKTIAIETDDREEYYGLDSTLKYRIIRVNAHYKKDLAGTTIRPFPWYIYCPTSWIETVACIKCGGKLVKRGS